MSMGASANTDPIRLGQIQISFYAVAGNVVREVLEQLDHRVNVSEGLHPDIFPRLGAGEIDLLVAAWLPHGHAQYWSKHGDCCVELGTLYQGAQFFWAVPDYIPGDQLDSVEQLAQPAVAAKMEKLIKGTGPGSGLMLQSKKMMSAYGLEAAGYVLEPSPGREWIKRVEDALQRNAWFVTPLWRPQYLNRQYPLRRLREPHGLLGGENRAVIVAHKSAVRRLPARTLQALRQISLGLEAVEQMDFEVNVRGKSPRDVAREWMRQHADQVQAWLGAPQR